MNNAVGFVKTQIIIWQDKVYMEKDVEGGEEGIGPNHIKNT